MSEKKSAPSVIKAYCQNCGGERNCEVKGHHEQSGSQGGYFEWCVGWYLLICKGCDFPFAQTISSDSETYDDYYDDHGSHVQEYTKTIETWPAKSKREKPEWFQHQRIEGRISNVASPLETSLSELYKSLDASLMVLSSIGIRMSFDVVAETLGVDANLTFAKKLDELLKGGHILASQKETLEVLVDAGNASAHRGWAPKLSEIHVLMDILEEFIYSSVILPTRDEEKTKKS